MAFVGLLMLPVDKIRKEVADLRQTDEQGRSRSRCHNGAGDVADGTL